MNDPKDWTDEDIRRVMRDLPRYPQPHSSDRERWRRMRQIQRGQLTGPCVTPEAKQAARDLLGDDGGIVITDR